MVTSARARSVPSKEVSTMTILVVDDSSMMRKIVIRSLRQAGFGDHDVEQAEALGCMELDEDDLALCTFVCP